MRRIIRSKLVVSKEANYDYELDTVLSINHHLFASLNNLNTINAIRNNSILFKLLFPYFRLNHFLNFCGYFQDRVSPSYSTSASL